MSSLKGQLSNVEGSVKSMKAAVVVGSVLTVACLAAVFGVTILANEVSKEVKVSNGVLSNKAGNTVVTASSVATQADSTGAHRATISQNGVAVSAAVNAVVSVANGKMYFCDDMIVNGAEFQNGLLNINLEKVVPEEKKPRIIPITNPSVIEHKKK